MTRFRLGKLQGLGKIGQCRYGAEWEVRMSRFGQIPVSSTETEAACREVYAETQSFYDGIASRLGSAALGFRVLYEPPIEGAPFLFLGYQPGGRIDTSDFGHHEGWPSHCDYATATWPLARRVRRV